MAWDTQVGGGKPCRALVSGTARQGRLPPEKSGRESPPHATFVGADLGLVCAPRARQRLPSPASLLVGVALPRALGETSANPATRLAPRAPATVAKGRGSSLRIPVAREYLRIQLRPRPRCLGAQGPQPRGRKNYRVERSAWQRRAPGASAGARGPTPSGESRAHLWVRGHRATVFPVPGGERRPRMERLGQGGSL